MTAIEIELHAIEIELHAECEPLQVSIEPPLIHMQGGILVQTAVKKPFRVKTSIHYYRLFSFVKLKQSVLN